VTIGYGELRKGMSIEIDGEPFTVVDYERSKMQQRAPVMKIRFRNIKTGKVMDRTFSGYDVSFTPASVDRRNARYIYDDEDFYYFMDNASYDQYPMSKSDIHEYACYLAEQLEVDLIFYEEKLLSLELPLNVDLRVTSSPPGVKGDTAQGASKFATLETGLELQVPLFINEGDVIKVDTRTRQYVSRI